MSDSIEHGPFEMVASMGGEQEVRCVACGRRFRYAWGLVEFGCTKNRPEAERDA